ncbi:MAG: hypothetical protein ISS74_06480 [Planctomycetes bacterium]|nr:hypothetical protein [Planctomycetota bacterium]
MSTAGWMTRVCAWFGRKADAPGDLAPEASWSGGGQLALVGTAVAEAEPPEHPAPVQSPDPFGAAPPAERDLRFEPPRTPEPERDPLPPAVHARPRPRIDPLDPPWMKDLAALETLGRELQGHRDTALALLRTVRQLPELTSDQTDHIVQTNHLLQRQATLLGSILDSLTGLGASMQSMAESSRRNLLAIGQLEASHREVLAQYQRLLLDSHRRLGRLAALATILSAIALGGVAVAVYLVLTAL